MTSFCLLLSLSVGSSLADQKLFLKNLFERQILKRGKIEKEAFPSYRDDLLLAGSLAKLPHSSWLRWSKASSQECLLGIPCRWGDQGLKPSSAVFPVHKQKAISEVEQQRHLYQYEMPGAAGLRVTWLCHHAPSTSFFFFSFFSGIEALLTWLIDSTVFLLKWLDFSIYNAPTNMDNLSSSFLILMPFSSFSSLIALAKTFSAILNNSGKSRQRYVVLDLSTFPPFGVILDTGL